LAEYIQSKYSDTEIRPVSLNLGSRLNNQVSSTGMYAIISHKGVILRVTLYKEIAEMLADDEWRFLYEISVTALVAQSAERSLKGSERSGVQSSPRALNE
jgi:hypothetical protein